MKPLAMMSLAVVALAAFAAGEFKPWTEVMQQADTDADGSVSMNEVKEYAHTQEFVGFQAFMADHFIALDRDNDGAVSNDELKSGIIRMEMTDDEVSEGFTQGFAFMPKP
jgi:Ca2+-binding EF-hand superfamily protein